MTDDARMSSPPHSEYNILFHQQSGPAYQDCEDMLYEANTLTSSSHSDYSEPAVMIQTQLTLGSSNFYVDPHSREPQINSGNPEYGDSDTPFYATTLTDTEELGFEDYAGDENAEAVV